MGRWKIEKLRQDTYYELCDLVDVYDFEPCKFLIFTHILKGMLGDPGKNFTTSPGSVFCTKEEILNYMQENTIYPKNKVLECLAELVHEGVVIDVNNRYMISPILLSEAKERARKHSFLIF